jgi:hypothetical protein
MTKHDIDKYQLYECQTIHGNHKAHQVWSISHQYLTLIGYWNLSCHYPKGEDANVDFPCEQSLPCVAMDFNAIQAYQRGGS